MDPQCDDATDVYVEDDHSTTIIFFQRRLDLFAVLIAVLIADQLEQIYAETDAETDAETVEIFQLVASETDRT